MKTALIFSAIILVGSIIGYILLPEGKVVQYRVEDTANRAGGYGTHTIRVVLDNEVDEFISVPNLSLEQALMMCDSLNAKLK